MMRRLRQLARSTLTAWQQEDAGNWAAALSFYTMMSLGPLVALAITTAALLFGEDAANRAMLGQIESLMGAQAAGAVRSMVAHAATPSGGFWTGLFGGLTLLFGATGVFAALQDAMDDIWHVKPRPDGGLKLWLKKRTLSASMVFGLGFLLMVSLAFDGALAAAWQTFGPKAQLALQVGEFVSAWLLGTALLAGMFKILPDAELAWRTAWTGASITALLLDVGKLAIGRYLGSSGVASPFGAAGSLAVLLIWVYYAAQLLFFGAVLTRVLAGPLHDAIRPSKDAQPA